MQELSVIQVGGNLVGVTAILTMKGNKSKEMYLCDNVTELFDAVAGKDKFVAHEVVGMQPRQVLISPDSVATVQVADK